MANYSTLKTAVADVVKTNGNRAITGANLQSVLLSIINSVGGGGYIFKGVATPSTNAGTPDENVFYVGGAGTYANFGTSVTVPVGAIGIFKYNGSWANEQIKMFEGIDDVPTAGSNNLVKSGGVWDITQKIDSVNEKSESVFNMQNGSNYTLLPVKAKTGDKIKVKLKTTSNSTLTRFEIYYNGLWSNRLASFNGAEIVAENINKWLEVTAPADITVIGWGVWNSSRVDETITLSFDNKESLENRVSKISYEIEELKESDQALSTEIENINSELGNAVQVSPDLVTGKFITESGTIATNSGYAYTDSIELKKCDEILVKAAGYGTAVAMISLYSNGTYTPVVISYGSGSIVRDYSYTAENDCNVVCSFSIASGLDHIISVRRFTKSPVSYDGIPYVSMFRTLLCIGDSTTAGVVDWRNPSVGADTVREYSWPTVFNKITGVPVFNYGQASATCKSWYINHYPNGNMGIPEGIPGREPVEGTVKYDACVIQLGVNDWFKIVSDLGRAPVNAEECASQIAEAKEYLGYLIEYTKVCSTSCKIFLATTSSAFNNRIESFFLSAWKTMLEELAVEYTDVFVVDINSYSKLEKEVFFYGHPTALGYAKTAKDLASYISYVVAQNIAQFRNVQFIRTNHSY